MRAIAAILVPTLTMVLLLGASPGCDGRAAPPGQVERPDMTGPSPEPNPEPNPEPEPRPEPEPKPEPEPQPTGVSCRFDGQGDPGVAVLATVLGNQLILVAADGSQRVVHTIGGGEIGSDRLISSLLLARGQHLVLSASFNPGDQPEEARREVVLLDRQGQVIWQRIDAELAWPVFLSETGVLVISNGESRLDVVTPDGQLQSREGVFAITEASAKGHLPVGLSRDENGVLTWGWLSIGNLAGRELPQARPTFRPYGADPFWLGDRLVYLGQDDGGRPLVVSERAGGTASPEEDAIVTVALPTRGADDSLYFGSVSRSGWLLASLYHTDPDGNSVEEAYRVNAHTGELAPLVLTFPAGQRAFQYSWPMLDDAGNLLQPLRDDTTGGMFRSADGASGWERLGAPVTGVLAMDVVTRNGSYLIFGATDRKGGEFEWETPAPDAGPVLAGPSLQVTRPGAPGSATLSGDAAIGVYSTHSLSDDGACFGYLHVDADSNYVLSTIEVQSGRTADVLTAPANVYNANLAWLGGR